MSRSRTLLLMSIATIAIAVGLAQPLSEDDEIALDLEFASAPPQTITVPVRAMAPMGEMEDG